MLRQRGQDSSLLKMTVHAPADKSPSSSMGRGKNATHPPSSTLSIICLAPINSSEPNKTRHGGLFMKGGWGGTARGRGLLASPGATFIHIPTARIQPPAFGEAFLAA